MTVLVSSIQEIARILREKHSFLLTTHVNPDGDGLGCEYGLYHVLRRLGKEVRVINAADLPENYAFLDGDVFETYDGSAHDSWIVSADVVMILDTNEMERIGDLGTVVQESEALKVIVDHHLHPSAVADLYFIDDQASSTGELVFSLLQELIGLNFGYEAALGLYTAIMTDTGSFRFPRSTPRVHRIVADLLEHGINPAHVYEAVYESYPLRRARLLGLMLRDITAVAGGRVTITTVTRAMFEEAGAVQEDVDDMVNYGLAIRGVEMTILLVETGKGVRMSFRSRGDVPVNELAVKFGGGGHCNAAGAFVSDTSLVDVRVRLEKELEDFISTRFGPESR